MRISSFAVPLERNPLISAAAVLLCVVSHTYRHTLGSHIMKSRRKIRVYFIKLPSAVHCKGKSCVKASGAAQALLRPRYTRAYLYI
jgi:hypothetical protein